MTTPTTMRWSAMDGQALFFSSTFVEEVCFFDMWLSMWGEAAAAAAAAVDESGKKWVIASLVLVLHLSLSVGILFFFSGVKGG